MATTSQAARSRERLLLCQSNFQSSPSDTAAAISAAAWNSWLVRSSLPQARHTASAKTSGSAVKVTRPTGIARRT